MYFRSEKRLYGLIEMCMSLKYVRTKIGEKLACANALGAHLRESLASDSSKVGWYTAGRNSISKVEKKGFRNFCVYFVCEFET